MLIMDITNTNVILIMHRILSKCVFYIVYNKDYRTNEKYPFLQSSIK